MDDTRVKEQHEDKKVPEEAEDAIDTSPDKQKLSNKPQKKNEGVIRLSDHKTAVEALQSEVNSLKTQLAELEEYKPKERSKAEIQLEQKQQSLFEKEIDFELKAANLLEFKEFFKPDSAEQLMELIKSFQELLNKRKVPTGFIPNDHKSQDRYSQAKSQGNVRDMIKAKLFG